MPVFICGCGHTGTTILSRILGEHSQLYCPEYESGAFVTPWKWAILLRLFNDTRRRGKGILVEKTPRHIRHIDDIRQLFPTARFILTVRDGRDVAASIAKREGESFASGAQRWLNDTEIVARNLGRTDTTLCRYEDFVTDPEAAICSICSWLGVAFEPSMLDFHKSPKSWLGGTGKPPKSDHERLRASQYNTPIFDGRGQWRGVLPSAIEDQLIDGDGKHLMQLFGYLSEVSAGP